ncbi:MAG: MFS transporter [Clostridia bacterium]|nr:MFS transporter [Clostridia bacterium]
MKTEKMTNRMTAHYALIQMLFNIVCVAVYGFSSVYLRAQGLSDSHIGVVMALGTVINIAAQPGLGSLADRTRKISLNHLLVCFYVIILAAAAALAPAMLPVWAVVGLYMLMSFGVSISETFTNSLAMQQVNRGIALNFGLARGIGSVGYAMGSLALGRLVAASSENAVMPFMMVFSVLSIAALLTFGRNSGERAAQEKPAQALKLTDFIRENKRFCLFVVGVALMYYCYCVRASYFYQIVLSVGGDVERYGRVSAFTAFIELPAMACFPVLSKKFKTRSILLFSAVCFLVRTLLLCFANSMAWVYLSQSMQMVSYALFVPSSVYYVNEMIGESNRNKGQSFLGMGQSVSSICASLCGGWMLTAAAGNPRPMLFTAVAVSAIGVFILFAVQPKKK